MRNADYFHARPQPPGPYKFKRGDRVCYTRYFLKSIGETPTGEGWFAKGVVGSQDGDYVSVKWSDGHDGHESRVLSNNLALDGVPSLRRNE